MTRTVSSLIGGRGVQGALGGRLTVANPACRAARRAQDWDYSGKLQKAQMDVAEMPADLSFRLEG